MNCFPAFLCSAAVIVVVSLLTAPPSQEIVDEFESDITDFKKDLFISIEYHLKNGIT